VSRSLSPEAEAPHLDGPRTRRSGPNRGHRRSARAAASAGARSRYRRQLRERRWEKVGAEESRGPGPSPAPKRAGARRAPSHRTSSSAVRIRSDGGSHTKWPEPLVSPSPLWTHRGAPRTTGDDPRTDPDPRNGDKVRNDDRHERHNGHGRKHTAQRGGEGGDEKVEGGPPGTPLRRTGTPGPYGASLRRHRPLTTLADPWPDHRRGAGPARASTPRRDRLGDADRQTSATRAARRLRAEGRRGPGVLSQLATNVVVSKYFRGHWARRSARRASSSSSTGSSSRSAALGRDPALLRDRGGPRRLPGRASPTCSSHQKMAFNSPVWFQRGHRGIAASARPALHSPPSQDTMSFESCGPRQDRGRCCSKFGSGAGGATSPRSAAPRGEWTRRRHGQWAPSRSWKGYDAFAGLVKSGGKDRPRQDGHILDPTIRTILRLHHSKLNRGEEGWALIEAGYVPLIPPR